MDDQRGGDPVTGTGTGVIYIELFRALDMGKVKSCCNCSLPSKDVIPFLSVFSLSFYKQVLLSSQSQFPLGLDEMSGFLDADGEGAVEVVRSSVRTPLPLFSNHSRNSSRSCSRMMQMQLSGMGCLGWFALCARGDCGTYPPLFARARHRTDTGRCVWEKSG